MRPLLRALFIFLSLLAPCAAFAGSSGAGGGGGAPTVPGGLDEEVQYNDAGAFDGDNALTLDKATDVVTVTGQLKADNLSFDLNTISSTDANGNIILAPNGTGDLVLSSGTQFGIGTASPAGGISIHHLASPVNVRLEASSGAVVLDLRRATSGDSNVLGLYTGSTRNFYLAHLSDGTVRLTRDSTGDDVTLTADGWLIPKLGQCRVASDQTNATTTLASSTCTISGLIATRKYPFQCWLSFNQSTAADGIKIAFGGGTATETTFIASVTIYDAALALAGHPDDLTDVSSAATLTGRGHAEIFGDFVPSANGTFLPQFAENASTAGDLTLHAGSWCKIRDAG